MSDIIGWAVRLMSWAESGRYWLVSDVIGRVIVSRLVDDVLDCVNDVIESVS